MNVSFVICYSICFDKYKTFTRDATIQNFVPRLTFILRLCLFESKCQACPREKAATTEKVH